MIYTARQLEQLHKTNGHVTLPHDARLTPAANDWVRARKVRIEYSGNGVAAACKCAEQKVRGETLARPEPQFLWWCDGPCGAAKAAILAHARDANLLQIEVGSDPSSTAAAVKHIAEELKAARISGAILAVQHGGAVMVMANRCSSLRAVLGTCLDSVDQALRRVGANVLVLEHSHRTLNEMRNMIRRFTTASRTLPPDVQRQLQELESCG